MASVHYSDDWLTVWQGDCRDALRQMPEKSVHTVITSPPYYGLRSYGTGTWDGGDPECEHEKVASGRGTNIPQTKNPNVSYPIGPHRGGNPNECVRCGAIKVEPTVWGGDASHEHEWGSEIPGVNRGGSGTPTDKNNRGEGYARGETRGNLCECGAWRGALGLEPTAEIYIQHLVEVFSEVWRVLRDDGVLWLNLGDSYAGGGGYSPNAPSNQNGSKQSTQHGAIAGRIKSQGDVKNKDLIGIPWMAAFALRSAGWYLRQDIVWNKPNAMPESVEDRPSRSHEFIFMLTKSARYFFDHLAVKEPASEATIKAVTARMKDPVEDREYQHDSDTRMGKRSPNRVWSDPEAMKRLLAGRNIRDVWTIPTVSYPGAHFATFAPKLVEPMIKASTSEDGVCSECGAQSERVVEKSFVGRVRERSGGGLGTAIRREPQGLAPVDGEFQEGAIYETVDWRTPCGHDVPRSRAVVLDPFGGSGTVAMVAQQFSRKAVLVDLNPEYLDQQLLRNAQVVLGL